MTPVVFVHGLMGGSAQWQGQVQALAEFDIIALDLPGFGKNAHMDAVAGIPEFADWALEELTKRGIHKFHLVGHSMGGMIAQEMVARAPVRIDRLVLYGTGASGVLPGRFETIATSKSRASAEGPMATARRIAATWFLEREHAAAYEACAAIAGLCRVDAILAGLDAMNGWSGTDDLARIDVKSLIVWGDHDRTYPWSQTAQLWQSVKGAHLAVIPGCAHASHLEKQDLFNAILKGFLTDQP
ncbi:MAG: 2-hydroxy-6-oxonona-2,4-dienedioate hydrolase [Paracoccaceae bacterium]|jgi:pimeloyl-ACP methyl ester carboxylesterase